MARSRNIKPGFFKNEALADLAFEYRLLFAGLWTLADRKGRLEDRPKRIRMELFPADNVDCEQGLQALSGAGLVVRYEAGGVAYIWIPTFLDHQTPHPRELESVIPPCLGETQATPTKETNSPSGNAQAPPRTDPSNAQQVSSPSDVLNPSNLNSESLEKRFPEVNHSSAPASVFGAAFEKLKGEPLSLAEAKIPGGDDTPAAILASVMHANGLKGNAFHPLIVEWSREGVTPEKLKAAIAKARQRPGKETGQFGPEYLDPILHDESKPAVQVHAEKASANAVKSIDKAQRIIAEQREAERLKTPMPEHLRPRKAAS